MSKEVSEEVLLEFNLVICSLIVAMSVIFFVWYILMELLLRRVLMWLLRKRKISIVTPEEVSGLRK